MTRRRSTGPAAYTGGTAGEPRLVHARVSGTTSTVCGAQDPCQSSNEREVTCPRCRLYCTPEELSLIMGEGEGQPSTASTSDGSERRAYTTPTLTELPAPTLDLRLEQPSPSSRSDGSPDDRHCTIAGPDELARARARRTVRATIGSLDDDARLILRGLGNASAAFEEAARRILGPRLTADELEELERMRVFALKIFSRLTPEELAELLAILAVRRAP